MDIKDRPFRVYNSNKYFDTDEVVFRTDSLQEASHKCKHFNKNRKGMYLYNFGE